MSGVATAFQMVDPVIEKRPSESLTGLSAAVEDWRLWISYGECAWRASGGCLGKPGGGHGLNNHSGDWLLVNVCGEGNLRQPVGSMSEAACSQRVRAIREDGSLPMQI